MKMGVVETKGEESGVESCRKAISDLLGLMLLSKWYNLCAANVLQVGCCRLATRSGLSERLQPLFLHIFTC